MYFQFTTWYCISCQCIFDPCSSRRQKLWVYTNFSLRLKVCWCQHSLKGNFDAVAAEACRSCGINGTPTTWHEKKVVDQVAMPSHKICDQLPSAFQGVGLWHERPKGYKQNCLWYSINFSYKFCILSFRGHWYSVNAGFLSP